MAHVEWKKRYNINCKEIDEQHKGLVTFLNRMIGLQGRGAAAYPNLERHKTEHARFIDQLLALNHTWLHSKR